MEAWGGREVITSILVILGLDCVASTTEIYFPTVLETEKPKIEALADSVSSEGAHCRSQTAAFSPCPPVAFPRRTSGWRGRGTGGWGSLVSLLMKALILEVIQSRAPGNTVIEQRTVSDLNPSGISQTGLKRGRLIPGLPMCDVVKCVHFKGRKARKKQKL